MHLDRLLGSLNLVVLASIVQKRLSALVGSTGGP